MANHLDIRDGSINLNFEMDQHIRPQNVMNLKGTTRAEDLNTTVHLTARRK